MSYEDEPEPFTRENDFIGLTRYEIADQLEDNGLVLLAAGSVEQHGPHLPVGTDSITVEAIAKRVAGKLDGLLVPFTPLGVTPLHMGMPGAISLEPETYMALFRDVAESLIEHGADEIVIVNWHEVNASTIETEAIRLQDQHPEVRIVIAQAHFAAQELYADYHDLSHGGPMEILPVLGARPDLVHLDRATDSAEEEHASKMDELRRNRRAYPIIPDVRIMYPSGWYGDLEGMEEYDGEEFLDRVADQCAADVANALEEMGQVDYTFDD